MSYLEKVVLNQLKTVTKLSLTFGQDTADRTAKADRRSQVECAQHLRNCNEQGAIEQAECGVSDGAWSWEGQYMTGRIWSSLSKRGAFGATRDGTAKKFT